MTRRQWLGLLTACGCMALALIGAWLLVGAWRSPGAYRALRAGAGIALLVLGVWYSGLVDPHPDSPTDPDSDTRGGPESGRTGRRR